MPVVPLPGPGEGGPVYPGSDTSQVPVIPLPNPGEGGPVCPGGGTIQPTPSGVRFLNAAYNYPSLRISVGNRRVASQLNYASVTGYGQVRSGSRTVTAANRNGRIYLQKTIFFPDSGLFTIAVVNTANGLDLLWIDDSHCSPGSGYGSFRVGNLAYNSGPLDVVMSDGRVVYSDLSFQTAAPFRRIIPGAYQFFYADTNQPAMPPTLDIETLDPAWLGVYPPYETFGSLFLEVSGGEVYTVYLLQNGSGHNNIQNLILVDR